VLHGKKIVVVMPAYNAELTLRRTHEEVLAQGVVDEVIVVGISAGSDLVVPQGDGARERAPEEERSSTFAGFYTRGLTLFESDQVVSDELRGIRFKVMSPHLQHTLSRDNVRRDGGLGLSGLLRMMRRAGGRFRKRSGEDDHRGDGKSGGTLSRVGHGLTAQTWHLRHQQAG
jgi:hypothetical protein